MRVFGQALRIAGIGLIGLLLILALAFGVLQTRPGKIWLAAALGHWLSDETQRVTINHIGGLVPFDMQIGSLAIADAQGPRIVVSEAAIAIAPADLLAGRLTLRSLTARELRIDRRAEGGGTTDLGALLHPPLAVQVDRLEVDRIVLGPALLGEPATLALTASGRVGGGSAAADLDLHRIDGAAGEARLHFAYGGTPARLDLAGEVAEPGGHVLAALLGRPEALPVAVHLAGSGPLADWHGTLAATAGSEAALDADIRIGGENGYHLTGTGTARLVRLLPSRLQPLIGDDARFSVAVDVTDQTEILDDLRIAVAGGTLSAHGRHERESDAVAGAVSLDLPNLAVLGPFVGGDTGGSLTADLTLGGRLDALVAHLAVAGNGLAFDRNRLERANADLDLHALGDIFSAATPIEVAAHGQASGLTPASGTLPGDLGAALDWRLALRLDRQTETVALRDFALEDGGSSITAEARLASGAIAGKAHLEVPEIARFAGPRVAGSLAADTAFERATDGTTTATLEGSLHPPPAGDSMMKALLGDEARLSASLKRAPDGALRIDDLAVSGAQLRFTGKAERAQDGRIAADYRLDLPRLAALDARLAGRAEIDGEVTGPSDALSGTFRLTGSGIGAGETHLDTLAAQAQLDLRRLSEASGRIETSFRAQDLAGHANSDLAFSNGVLRLGRLQLDAAGTRLDGDLAVTLANSRVDGTLSGRVPDLGPWSTLLGTPIAGSAQMKARLAGGRGQSIEVALDGKSLSWGAPTPLTARRFHLAATFTDLFGTPSGRADVQLDDGARGGLSLAQLRLSGESVRAGRFALDGKLRGSVGETVELAFRATATLADQATEVRVSQLSGKLGDQPVQLRRPLLLSRDATGLAFADLALALGKGGVYGAGSLKGERVSLRLRGESLPVGALAALGGTADIGGAIGFDIALGGTRERPQGDLVLSSDELRFAALSQPDLPPLAMAASASWRGDRVSAKGRIEGPHNTALGFTAALPLALDPQSLAPRLPPQGALAFHLEGDGELANIVDLLPIGEDRLAGRFFIDVAVGGTVAAPSASGRLTLRDGQYESMAAGTVLAGISLDLVGNRDRLVLQSFRAGDGDGGTLALAGAVDLAAAAGPVLDLSGQIKSFRVLRRDEANVTASGDARLTGGIMAPKLAASLRVESAELRVPERLPQNVQPISVVTINSATGETLSTPEEAQPKPWLQMALDATVDLPGQVFVRGRGLDSEWRGRLTIRGTTAEPQLTGRLEVARGTYDFLGKSARLSRGAITFLGGARIDPAIDIEAQVSSADVVAIVRISGTAMQPKITLSSQPELPQDEILSRVLFGTSISQISTAQGLELAQAAAALATGGGPGVLDRIRQGLGLDRLSIGSAKSSPVANINVPALGTTPGIPGSTPSGAVGSSPLPVGAAGAGVSGSSSPSAAAVSAGKYVANGVYVGVTQGITSGSSSVDVQIDVTRHITIDTTAGQNTGAGLGINWKLDY